MNRQEFEEKLERGIAQVRDGQGIVKTMEELECMAEETRIAQIQLPDPADADPHPSAAPGGPGYPCWGGLYSPIPRWLARHYLGGEMGDDRPRLLVHLYPRL